MRRPAPTRFRLGIRLRNAGGPARRHARGTPLRPRCGFDEELGLSGQARYWLRGIQSRSLPKTCWRITATTATFPEAVQENEEVVPVNAVSTWVLPSRVTAGR
ncbi:hypothetical protein C5613_27115 [Rhodococcus opacus]|nr:hypothetical protein C5613_27115 [Rhodococcus opacus]